eukprot:3479288-Amphidinium_carterae.1
MLSVDWSTSASAALPSSTELAPPMSPSSVCMTVDLLRMGPSRSFLANLQYFITNLCFLAIIIRDLRPSGKAAKEHVEPTADEIDVGFAYIRQNGLGSLSSSCHGPSNNSGTSRLHATAGR